MTLISMRKLSRPLSIIVLLYPLSARQAGQVFVKASGPVYQALTRLSHLMTDLQHFDIITGGLIGIARQKLH